MEKKHILVLCQRKASHTDSNVEKVSQEINRYIEENYGANVVIEYLTSGVGDEDSFDADYKFALNNDSAEALHFIETHKEYYSAIILNTCPFTFMDYKIIYNLLKPDGILAFKAFTIPQLTRNDPLQFPIFPNAIPGLIELFDSLFVKRFDFVYAKVPRGGKRRTKIRKSQHKKSTSKKKTNKRKNKNKRHLINKN